MHFPGRNRIWSQIQKLDLEQDYFQISFLSGFHEFPWETTRALEFALFRTFAVSTIGGLLDRTKEFENATQKRYDDTDLLLREIMEHSPKSERGSAAIERMNFIHSHFKISNEDFLYVLSTFVFEPKRFIDKFGYRETKQKEDLAVFALWREIGTRMKIQDIPETREEFEKFNLAYEKKYFAFTPGGRRVADATLELFLGWYVPKFLFPMVKPFGYALMDDALLEAFNYPKPSGLVKFITIGALKFRAVLHRFKPARRKPKLKTGTGSIKTYPKGYAIEKLGPEKMK